MIKPSNQRYATSVQWNQSTISFLKLSRWFNFPYAPPNYRECCVPRPVLSFPGYSHCADNNHGLSFCLATISRIRIPILRSGTLDPRSAWQLLVGLEFLYCDLEGRCLGPNSNILLFVTLEKKNLTINQDAEQGWSVSWEGLGCIFHAARGEKNHPDIIYIRIHLSWYSKSKLLYCV